MRKLWTKSAFAVGKLTDKLWMKLAWALPKRLVMWAAIRLIAHATQGKYSNQEVPALGAMEALTRWTA